MLNFTLHHTQSNDPDFIRLVELLDAELYTLYPKEQDEYAPYNKIDFIETVTVAYDGDQAVGCGCFRDFDQQTVEIKRMFVMPAYRGKGLSKRILDDLENWALEKGFTQAILETGKNQPQAIGLYTQNGYEKVPNFGRYADIPNSLCYMKTLFL